MSQKNNLPSSICVLRLSSIGDITHMIPVIKTIQHNLPKSDITWIIGKTEYPLVKNMKEVRFIIIDKSKNLKSIINPLISINLHFIINHLPFMPENYLQDMVIYLMPFI